MADVWEKGEVKLEMRPNVCVLILNAPSSCCRVAQWELNPNGSREQIRTPLDLTIAKNQPSLVVEI